MIDICLVTEKENCVIRGFLCKRSKDVVLYLAGSMFSVLLTSGGHRTGRNFAVCASTAVKVFGDLCWESGLCVNDVLNYAFKLQELKKMIKKMYIVVIICQ